MLTSIGIMSQGKGIFEVPFGSGGKTKGGLGAHEIRRTWGSSVDMYLTAVEVMLYSVNISTNPVTFELYRGNYGTVYSTPLTLTKTEQAYLITFPTPIFMPADRYNHMVTIKRQSTTSEYDHFAIVGWTQNQFPIPEEEINVNGSLFYAPAKVQIWYFDEEWGQIRNYQREDMRIYTKLIGYKA